MGFRPRIAEWMLIFQYIGLTSRVIEHQGSALLQKKFTVDFLTKKQKVNEGEVPQYFVEHSHPPIIDPEEFEMVQAEIERRKGIGRVYSSSNIFSAKLVCSCCESFFGSKVWHSTSKYRCVIWQCNHKFSNGEKCTTPHLYEDEIKKKFIEVCSKVFTDKAEFISSCREIVALLSDCTALDKKIEEAYTKLDDLTTAKAPTVKQLTDRSNDMKLRFNAMAQEYNHLLEVEAVMGKYNREIRKHITQQQNRRAAEQSRERRQGRNRRNSELE